jgi:hypothetical protein
MENWIRGIVATCGPDFDHGVGTSWDRAREQCRDRRPPQATDDDTLLCVSRCGDLIEWVPDVGAAVADCVARSDKTFSNERCGFPHRVGTAVQDMCDRRCVDEAARRRQIILNQMIPSVP